MKKITLFIAVSFFVACGSKQTQALLSNGNYDEAINKSIKKLASKKDAKGNQDYVYILQDAYAKANARDLKKLILPILRRFLIYTINWLIVKKKSNQYYP